MWRLWLLIISSLSGVWLFLAWAQGKRRATWALLLLCGVGTLVVLGEALHFGPAWILLTAWILFALAVSLSTLGKQSAWQTILVMFALIGFGSVGILVPALGYPEEWVPIGDGLILLVIIVVGAVMGFRESE